MVTSALAMTLRKDLTHNMYTNCMILILASLTKSYGICLIANYPDSLEIGYFINVPWVFNAFWFVIRKLLDES